MKKAIHLTSQGIEAISISPHKPMRFVSLNFDSARMTIDAYSDMFKDAKPREHCLITLADEKTVFEFTTEDLFEILRFYTEYSADNGRIVSYRNKSHFIIKDPVTQG